MTDHRATRRPSHPDRMATGDDVTPRAGAVKGVHPRVSRLTGREIRSRAMVLIVVLVMSASLSACNQGFLGGGAQRGERALEQGDYRAALVAFNEAISGGDASPITYANRCIAHDALGNHEDAVRDCSTALDLAEERGEEIEGFQRHKVLNNRGVAYLNQRKYEEALEDFDAAIELEPEYAEAFANRGRVRLDQERYEDAIDDLTRAVEINPELAEAYGNRGLAFQYLTDGETALEDFTRAIEINDNPQAYYNRAALNYTMGHWEDAYNDYNSVLEHGDPGSYIYYIAETQAEFLENRPTAEPGASTSEDGEEDGQAAPSGDADDADAEVSDGDVPADGGDPDATDDPDGAEDDDG